MTGGNVTLGANSSTFTVNDGSKSTDITIDSTSLDATGTALGAAATTSDRVKEAIQRKLDEAGFDVTVGNATNTTLTFTSKDVGTGSALTVTGKTSTVDLGFGTTTGTSGTRTVGTGTAASGLSAKGSDATDGSAKALINGTKVLAAATGGPPATAGGLDFSGDNDASFNLQIGDGQAKKITLNSDTILSLSAGKEFTSAQDIADTINSQIAADTGLSGKVSASVDENNKLVISSTSAGSDQKISITAAQGTTVANNLDIGFGTQTSTINSVATNTATTVSGFGKDSTGSTNTTRQSLAKQFNEILNQITQQAKDSSYNGINLLYRSGDDTSENSLKVTFNETGSSSLTISGAKLDSDGLGLTASTGGFQTDTEINQTLTAITAATSQLRGQASTFGSNLSVVQKPSGLLEEPDQHPRHRLGQPDERGPQRGSRQLPGPVDPPVDRHLGPLARQHGAAGHPAAPPLSGSAVTTLSGRGKPRPFSFAPRPGPGRMEIFAGRPGGPPRSDR